MSASWRDFADSENALAVSSKEREASSPYPGPRKCVESLAEALKPSVIHGWADERDTLKDAFERRLINGGFVFEALFFHP